MNEKLPRATHQGILRIGEAELPCFVLDDGRRVISGRGMTKAIGMKGRGQGVQRISTHKTLKPYLQDDLTVAIENPIPFLGKSPRVQSPSAGYEATILVSLCEAILEARDADVLKTEQEKRYAKYCETLVRAFAKVGIIALVDEATGYQDYRARKALEQILDKFIAEELSKWAKTFPDEFYQNMFRLKNWPYNPKSVKRPSVIGRYTEDLVYKRLAPGVLEELKRINPRDEKGRLKHKYFQWLTQHEGYRALKEHLAAVVALMKASSKWDRFYGSMERALPKYGETIDMFPELWGKDEE